MSMSISISNVFPISPLPCDIMSWNQSQRLLNFTFMLFEITLSSRSTFLWVSTSAGDLMKLLVDVRILCKSVSVSMWSSSADSLSDAKLSWRFTLVISAISAIGCCGRCGTQWRGVVSTFSMSKHSSMGISFCANATTWFFGNSRY